MTPVLAKMERTGLIVRCPHPTDGRSRMLRLTAEGEKKLAELAICATRHDSRLDGIVGPEGKSDLVGLLRKLIAGLAQSHGKPSDDPGE